MNKLVIILAFIVSLVLVHACLSARTDLKNLQQQLLQVQQEDDGLNQQIVFKQSLAKEPAMPLATAYGAVLNEIRLLETYSGTSMNVHLQGVVNSDDISSHYENSLYPGIRGLKVQIVVDKFSKETDMGAVLDDIHLLEKHTDFMATEISKDNNNLIVKGEIYGL